MIHTLDKFIRILLFFEYKKKKLKIFDLLKIHHKYFTIKNFIFIIHTHQRNQIE